MDDKEAEKSETAKREEEILKFWKENKIFQKTLEKESPKGEFVFYDGPPFATGLPHYGSLLSSIVKDVIPRYKTMRGCHVRRRWGWDCHGLPIENMVEKRMNLKTKKDIETLGISKFSEACRSAVLETANDWKRYVERVGRWVEFDDAYKTMDNSYIESVWWAFKQMWDKGLVYEGRKVLMYCPRCETPLSKAEVAMDHSYKDITEDAITVKFKLKPGQKIGNFETDNNTYVLAWTTTPWTLPANLALAVNENVKYVITKKGNDNLILANKKGLEGNKIKGKDLVGLEYESLFGNKMCYIVAADFVTTNEGTGIVHIAPMYGEDDYNLGLKLNLPITPLLDSSGHFNPPAGGEIPEFIRGQYYKKANKIIIEDLEKRQLIFSKEKHTHSYPHCHRCETPLIYNALPSWFVNIQKVKKRLMELNEKINWFPKHLKRGRFLKIIEDAPDWNISRNRYWASPLPIWKCQNCGETEVIGSLKELEERIKPSDKNLVIDLHRPYIDEIVFNCRKCGGEMRRITEVLDGWFESSSMPFAEYHYPFENKEQFNKRFPGDFVAEYIAQARTWFYYMHVIAVILFDDIGFKNVFTTGNILAEDGSKMSKSKGNYTDPMINLHKYGADALRYYLVTSVVMQAEDVRFLDKEIKEAQNKVVNILWNTFKFFELYKKDYDEKIQAEDSNNILDKWILTRLSMLIKEVTEGLDNYNTVKAGRPIRDFIEDLSTWYLRRSRDRLKGEDETDKSFAFATMQYVLTELAKIIAPFMPFIAESIYKNAGGKKESVHLEEWAASVKTTASQAQLIKDMDEVRKIVSLGLEARAKVGIKVRQPLISIKVKSKISNLKSQEQLLRLIKDELNVKEVIYDDKILSGVELETVVTPDLKEEGDLRELVRALQDTRKKAGLSPGQKIALQMAVNHVAQKFLEKFEGEIKKTVGIERLEVISSLEGGQEIKINDKILRFKITT